MCLDLRLPGWSAPLSPALFKGQLHIVRRLLPSLRLLLLLSLLSGTAAHPLTQLEASALSLISLRRP